MGRRGGAGADALLDGRLVELDSRDQAPTSQLAQRDRGQIAGLDVEGARHRRIEVHQRPVVELNLTKALLVAELNYFASGHDVPSGACVLWDWLEG